MSQEGELSSLTPLKRETQVTEKGKNIHSQIHGDQRTETHQDCGGMTGSRVSCSQDGKYGIVDNPAGTKSGYGSIDTVSVCRSCQHLYAGNVEVVLSPGCLEDHLPHPDRANPRPVSMHRPWAANKYESLCDRRASVSGSVCACSRRPSHGQRFLCCEIPYVQKLKVVALVLAAIIPWVFLVTYIVLTSI